MSAEETLIQIRKDKHQEINGGKYPLARAYNEEDNLLRWRISDTLDRFSWLSQLGKLPQSIDLSDFQSEEAHLICGRITALRKAGAITFLKVTDVTGSIQLIASKAALPNYQDLKLLDLGDIVEVTGWLCLSKTGEQSVLLSDIRVLTKSHRPPPEKFAGITDTELKYRKRYLDLMSSEESRARFIVRTHILRAIRSFMDGRRFLEVETSTLNVVASGANAKPFITHHNALDTDLRLRIAPELYLKRLLVGGLDRVYEIGRNYRNEGIDTRHNPEFTMMESYQAYGRFEDLIVSTKELLLYVQDHLKNFLPNNIKSFFQDWDELRDFSLEHFVEIPMWDAVIHACGKAEIMMNASIHPLIAESQEVTNLKLINLENERLKKIDIKGLVHALDECPSNGHKIYTMFEYVVEPFLTEDYRSEDGKYSCPVFITQYPKAVSPLARAHDKASTLCERFELFVEGRELANAFQELNDPDEQLLRFQLQLENNDKDPMAFDADYIEALQYGMPPAIGFGMGIDRLVMLFTNTTSIKDVILFPTLKPRE